MSSTMVDSSPAAGPEPFPADAAGACRIGYSSAWHVFYNRCLPCIRTSFHAGAECGVFELHAPSFLIA